MSSTFPQEKGRDLHPHSGGQMPGCSRASRKRIRARIELAETAVRQGRRKMGAGSPRQTVLPPSAASVLLLGFLAKGVCGAGDSVLLLGLLTRGLVECRPACCSASRMLSGGPGVQRASRTVFQVLGHAPPMGLVPRNGANEWACTDHGRSPTKRGKRGGQYPSSSGRWRARRPAVAT